MVEQLRSAASAARSQGDAKHAVRLLDRALLEPPPAAERMAVLEEAAYADFAVMDPAAVVRFQEAREESQDPQARARLALWEGMALMYAGDHRSAIDRMIAAADEASAHPELREDWLMLEAFLALVRRYDLATVGESAGRLQALADEVTGATPAERLIVAFLASIDPGETAADLVAATDLQVEALGLAPWAQHHEGVGEVNMYVYAGRPDKARALADRMVAEASERQLPLKHAMALAARGIAELEVGELVAAAADLEQSDDEAQEFGAEALVQANSGIQVAAWTLMGDLDRAEQILAARDLTGEIPNHMILNPSLFARGTLRMEQRRFEEAASDLADLGRRYERITVQRPSPPWRSVRALALDALGRRDEGRALAEEELAIAEVWDTPKSIAVAERAVALLSEPEESLPRLERAEKLLRDGPWRLDRARARLDLGAALRRSGERRRGRELLAQAMEEAEACGAGPMAVLAAEELRASGARPRRRPVGGIDALTPSELRVSRLAAEGRTNREIAQELFVTMATVETHLTRAYRKLDLDGRDGLKEALSGAAPPD